MSDTADRPEDQAPRGPKDGYVWSPGVKMSPGEERKYREAASTLVEIVARAMADKLSEQQLGSVPPWHDSEFRQNAMEVSQAALAAIEGAGYVIVKRELLMSGPAPRSGR